MIYFQSDYVEGCHPKILEKMAETNLEQTPGYGNDDYCADAREKIRKACGREDVDVHFLVGGTQTNATVIASILKAHQGVISADTGHIACHETGAVEAAGHKVLTLPSKDGTITAEQVAAYCEAHAASTSREHMVQPGMVYISFPTESGTLYSKEQLTSLYAACQKYGLPLYVDGARLGYGLAGSRNDLTLPDIARLCDVFYIGGTKCGALFGEAVVIARESLKKDFRYIMKQHGGMLAKGRLLGIQFDVLFEDDLYEKICKNAVDAALKIRGALEDKGIPLYVSSWTNQQFPILTQAQMQYFSEHAAFEIWEPIDERNTAVRFCTSWATTGENVQSLVELIRNMPI